MIEVEIELLEALLDLANNNWTEFQQVCVSFGVDEGEIEEMIINLEDKLYG